EAFKKVPIFDDLSFSGNYNLAADSNRLSTISLNLRTKIAGTVLNISGTLNPYALDSKGNVTRYYMWEKASGIAKLGRITNLSTGFDYSFGSSQIEKRRKDREAKSGRSEEKETSPDVTNPNFQSFNFPWNIKFSFHINYLNPKGEPKIDITQTLSLDGNIDITPKWKANFSSGFDLNAMKFSHTNFSVTRDLHCWTMSFSFTPISKTPYYMFTLSANSAMLKDLKVEKQSASMYSNY
ncbi:MAG TPA: putative LPS assembly protein LptD, partial [Prolixibacteraceae bacterium]|nr:putative LPS assembly protein LptD [Prolixibacteraceae bacterium]